MTVCESQAELQLKWLSELAARCQHVSYRQDFLTSVYPALHRLVAHDKFACGIVSMRDSSIVEYFNVDFPRPLLESLGMDEGRPCPFFNLWKRGLQPILFDIPASAAPDDEHGPGHATFRRLGLHNLATHGVTDLSQQLASYFGFSRKARWRGEDEQMLRMVVPHLHIALTRLAQRQQEAPVAGPAGESLSPREREILGWMCLGKSNIEIATILGISFWTVKIHVSNLMKKLMVCNRSQAVARAITLGIIPAHTQLPVPEASKVL